PLYYVLSWLWVKLSGSDSATALRMASLLAGVATVPVGFLAARRFVGDRLALVVAWLCAVSPILVLYSIYARAYALLVLTCALSLWALGALLESPSRRRWLLWAAAAAACLWTHYFAVFVLAGEVCVLAVRLPRERVRLVLSLAAVAAATIPLWSLFGAQSGSSERTGYIAAEPLRGRLEGVVRQFAMGTNVPAAWLEGAGIALAALAVLYALWQGRRRESTLVLVTLVALGAGAPILGALTRIDDHLLPRNVLGTWICVAPLAAYGLTRLRALPLAAYSVVCVAAVIAVQGDWRYQGSTDWSGASARIQAQAAADPVAVMPGLELQVAALYMRRVPLSAPVSTRDLWVMVQPARGAGQRALHPIANPPLQALWGASFQAVGEIDYRGFRLIHLHASVPVAVPPAPTDNGPVSTPNAFVLAP
ncbi:MAG TPA: glycosyltransferase family 39 protein, partial [Solirubrobacteraceae bacterium]|nr:glycosyltransferase family 39 protein [Solirubrobacteraceae bacterium]